MSGALEKSLALLEYLTDYPDGAGLAEKRVGNAR
jgi:hypothetical protein